MHIKKNLMLFLSCLLIFVSLPLATFAEKDSDKESKKTDANVETSKANYGSKDEVIYGKLGANGKTKNMYVVNSFFLSKPGEVIDYGHYINVRNLTDLTDVDIVSNDEVHFQANDEFYYQGELDFQTLPWDIDITYRLDGKEMNPESLAGKSGDLEIQIETKQNKSIDSVFFDYYLLQLTVTLDPLIFYDIQAPKGTEANEGKNKIIAFNAMPGQEEIMIISTRVENLKMDPIQITAIPANIAIENPDTDDLTGEIKQLSDAIHDINSGVGDLSTGAASLRSGAAELSNGSESYKNGINELNGSSGELVGGSKEILGALQQITSALDNAPEMPDLGDLEQLPAGLRGLAKEIRAFTTTLEGLKAGIDQIPEGNLTDEQINEIYTILTESEADASVIETVSQLEASYRAAQTIKQLSQELPDQLEPIIRSLADNVELTANGIEDALGNLDQLDDLVELQNGLSQLSTEYQTFHNGLVSYTDGVGSLANSYGKLNAGTKSLADGTRELESGVNELKNGTQQLADETDDLPEQIKSEIEKFMDEFDYSDFEPTSFISDKNENVRVVQFVLQTESIKLAEVEKEPEIEEVKKGMWGKFLDLFS